MSLLAKALYKETISHDNPSESMIGDQVKVKFKESITGRKKDFIK
jgi:hypothetical protein